MSKHADLLARLKAASEQDRELDALIYCAAFGHIIFERDAYLSGIRVALPDGTGSEWIVIPWYTRSLDAITGLYAAQFGTITSVKLDRQPLMWCTSYIEAESNPEWNGIDPVGSGQTFELACCIAFVTALEARSAANG